MVIETQRREGSAGAQYAGTLSGKITRRGLNVLTQDPPYLDTTYLKRFPEFRAYLH